MNQENHKTRCELLFSSIEDYQENYSADINSEFYFAYPIEAILNAEERLLSQADKNMAYFSMEFGLAPSIYNSFTPSKAELPIPNFPARKSYIFRPMP